MSIISIFLFFFLVGGHKINKLIRLFVMIKESFVESEMSVINISTDRMEKDIRKKTIEKKSIILILLSQREKKDK